MSNYYFYPNNLIYQKNRQIYLPQMNNINNISNINNRFINDDMPNKTFNINTNEHSSDKKNINKIRKESYHSNQNINVNLRNKHGSAKEIKNFEQQNFATESENTIEQSKLKIVAFDNFAWLKK